MTIRLYPQLNEEAGGEGGDGGNPGTNPAAPAAPGNPPGNPPGTPGIDPGGAAPDSGYVIPDNYSSPEGADQALTEELAAFAKSHKLSQEHFDALYAREVALQTALQNEQTQLQNKWREELKADPQIGAKLDENLGVAKRALEAFFPGLAKEASSAVFLDHPEIVRGLVKLGQHISPDGDFVAGKTPDAGTDHASILFPSMR